MAWTFYQLTAIDGTNKPLAWYRYDGTTPQYWDGSSWQKSDTLLEKLSEGDPMLDKLNADPTTKPEISKSEGSISTEHSVMKGSAMTDNFDTTPEWEIDLTKGGPGSGPEMGHPFRGNGITGGIQNAMAHNPRGEVGWGRSEHLDAANAHLQAALAAHNAGNHGAARWHFNEVAYHAGLAGHPKFSDGKNRDDRSIHQQAKTLEYAAHHAGDEAGRAGHALRVLAKLHETGASPRALMEAAGNATKLHGYAERAATVVSTINNGIQASRMANALSGVASVAHNQMPSTIPA